MPHQTLHHSSANSSDNSPRTRLIAGVLAGGGTLIILMLLLALATVLLGGLGYDADGRVDLGPWLVLEVLGGACASIIAGLISRRVGRSYRATAILGGIVLCMGLLEAATIMSSFAAEVALPSRWLIIAAPFVAGAGILAGGLGRGSMATAIASFGRIPVLVRYSATAAVFVGATAVAIFALPNIADSSRSHVVATAVTLDFTIAAPALFYVLVVRKRRLPWIAVVPVIVAGYAMASATIPNDDHHLLKMLRFVAIPAELFILGYLAILARRAFRGAEHAEGDFATRLRTVARRMLQSRIPADILTTEIAILHYAFGRRPPARQQASTFTVYREVTYFPVLLGLCVVLFFETIGVHLLVVQWSKTLAWVLTGLSVYAMIWLVGDYRAMIARPIVVSIRRLALRVGLRWEADIPLGNIRRAEVISSLNDPEKGRALKAALIGQPNVRVVLKRATHVIGMYGIQKSVTDIRLTVDNAGAFVKQLNLLIDNGDSAV